jgi:Domain of unknown function (DUF1906)
VCRAATTTQRILAAFFLALVTAVWPSSRFEGHKDARSAQTGETKVYLGFDRNDYPGDAALPVLRKTFSFSGYWLTPPPGEKQNTWSGKKKILDRLGFGFLLLARGRESATIRSGAKEEGIADASEAARSAYEEGFGAGSILFLDVEDGGRLPPEFHAYLRTWTDELVRRGFRPGIYCSGVPVNEGRGNKIVTADDVRTNEGSREIAFWVFNDMCPPSLGCRTSAELPGPAKSGVRYAAVWQFVRSPREEETASRCTGYAEDGNCYAAADAVHRWHLDLDVADSKNPSAPR